MIQRSGDSADGGIGHRHQGQADAAGDLAHLLQGPFGGDGVGLGQHGAVSWQVDARPLYLGGGLVRREARAALQWQLDRAWGLRAEMRWREAADGAVDAEFSDAQIVLHHYY